jgi:hypothetical protein
MTIEGRAKVSLSFVDAADTINVWESLEWKEAYLDPIGSLRVRLRPLRKQVKEYLEKTTKGSLIKLFFDDAQQCAYLITTRQTTIGGNGVLIDLEAKSVLVTPYEGSVNPNIAKKYGASVKISDVVFDAMADYGFEEVFIKESLNLNIKAGGQITDSLKEDDFIEVDKMKHKDIQPQPSETAYGFCSRIFSRYGVVLHVDAFGSLMLSTPRFNDKSIYTINSGPRLGGNSKADRAIGDINFSETNDGVFSEVVVSGRKIQNKKTKRTNQPVFRLKVDSDEDNSKSIPGRPNVAYQEALTGFLPPSYFYYSSDQGAPYKPKFITDKSSQDKERCENLAFMSMHLNTSRAFTLSCKVDGIKSRTGNIWTINTMCDVDIDMFGVDPKDKSGLVLDYFEPVLNKRMLVFEKTVRVDASGQTTSLTLIPEFSLRLGPRPGEK